MTKKDSSSSDSSSEEETSRATKQVVKAAAKKESSSDESSDDALPKKIITKPVIGKKRARQSSSDEADETAVTPVKKPEKKRKRQSSPFRRVKSEEITLFNCVGGEKLGDRMAVDVKGGVVGWGKRAHEQLKTVKGKKFTHEKNKKKRGSYSGGLIETSVNSIKFPDDIW